MRILGEVHDTNTRQINEECPSYKNDNDHCGSDQYHIIWIPHNTTQISKNKLKQNKILCKNTEMNKICSISDNYPEIMIPLICAFNNFNNKINWTYRLFEISKYITFHKIYSNSSYEKWNINNDSCCENNEYWDDEPPDSYYERENLVENLIDFYDIVKLVEDSTYKLNNLLITSPDDMHLQPL